MALPVTLPRCRGRGTNTWILISILSNDFTWLGWRGEMDIFRELGPKVRPAIEGPFYCAHRINFPAWVPAIIIAIMALGTVTVWRWGR